MLAFGGYLGGVLLPKFFHAGIITLLRASPLMVLLRGSGHPALCVGGLISLWHFWPELWNDDVWEAGMATLERVDWSECSLIEVRPGVQGGAPVLRGTRMPGNAIVDNFDYGMSVSEIAEQFELPADRVEAIVNYAQSHRVAHPV
jgi:uncharacterized protein (DUF433 family)